MKQQNTPGGRRRPLWTVPDVADYMATANKTVRGWLAAGELKCIRINSRTIRIRPDALDEFLAKREARAAGRRRRSNPQAVRAAD